MTSRGPRSVQARRSRQGGLGLLVVAAALVMVGAAAVVGETTLRQVAHDRDARLDTTDKLRGIERALVRFVARHGRLPCPADGAAPVDDSGGRESVPRQGGNQTDCGSLDIPDAVVPWTSLGLGPEYAVDAWGQRIGFVVPDGNVAPVADQSLVQPGGMDFLTCLEEIGAADPTCVHGLPDPVALNAILTADPAFDPNDTDQTLDDLSQATQDTFMTALREQVMGQIGLRLIERTRDIDALDPDPSPDDLEDDAEPRVDGLGAAFVLVSHGENGLGARTPGGGATPPAASAAEQANVDGSGDTDFATFNRVAFTGGTDAAAFDDVLRAMTVRDLAEEAGLWELPDQFLQQVHILAGGSDPGPCETGMDDFVHAVAFDSDGAVTSEEGDPDAVDVMVEDVELGNGLVRASWSSELNPLRMQAVGGGEYHLALGGSGEVMDEDLDGNPIESMAFCEGVGEPGDTPDVGDPDDEGDSDDEGGDDGGDSDDGDRGHGNDDDGFDEDNPGQGGGPRNNDDDGGDSDDGDRGHGNDDDGFDEDNPGQGGGPRNNGGNGS